MKGSGTERQIIVRKKVNEAMCPEGIPGLDSPTETSGSFMLPQ